MTSDILERPLLRYVHSKFILFEDETPAIDAIRKMYLNGSDTIIVTKQNRLVGIVTNTDILNRLFVTQNDKRVSAIPLKDVMSSPVIILTNDSTVKHALRMMKSNNVKHIVVIDKNVVKRNNNTNYAKTDVLDPKTQSGSTNQNHPARPNQILGIVTLKSISDDLKSSFITRKSSFGSPILTHYHKSIKLHYRPIIGNLGFVMQFAGMLFVVPALVGTFLQDDIKSTVGIYLSSISMLAMGFILNTYGIKGQLGLKQGANLVISSFIILGFFASIPYMYGDQFVSPFFGNGTAAGYREFLFLDSYFESISGLTTTGLTTVSNISDFSDTFSFYRSYTQLVGGLSFIYLIVLIFYPEQKLISMRNITGWGSILSPRALTLTIVVIFSSYITILSLITYLLGGINGIDAISITVTTITGSGFNPVPGYISIEHPMRIIILLAGMIISALPFAFHYSIFSRRYRSKGSYETILVYLLFLLAAFVVFHLLESSQWTSDNFLTSVFNVISASTTTGLNIGDSVGLYLYSVPAQILLMILMMIGGIAFSTAGGIKIDRIVLIFRRLFRLKINFNHIIPGITSVRYRYQYRNITHFSNESDKSDPNISSLKEVKETLYIVALFILVSFTGGLVLSYNTGNSFQDSVFESISALTTTGLTSGITTEHLDPSSKILLILNMIAGRFEIITIVFIFIGLFKGIK